MPFDGLRPEIAARQKLIDALRRQPEVGRSEAGFAWDFGIWWAKLPPWRDSQCNTVGCAIGLAKEIGFDLDVSTGAFSKKSTRPQPHYVLGRMVGLSTQDAKHIFSYKGYTVGIRVTPSMVADALERAPYDFTS